MMKKQIVLAFVFIALASSAFAQDTKPMPTFLKIANITFAVSSAADEYETARGFAAQESLNARGFTWSETNRLASWAPGATGTMSVLLAEDVAAAWAWHHFVGRKHPKIAAVGLFAESMLRTYLAFHNARCIAHPGCTSVF